MGKVSRQKLPCKHHHKEDNQLKTSLASISLQKTKIEQMYRRIGEVIGNTNLKAKWKSITMHHLDKRFKPQRGSNEYIEMYSIKHTKIK